MQEIGASMYMNYNSMNGCRKGKELLCARKGGRICTMRWNVGLLDGSDRTWTWTWT